MDEELRFISITAVKWNDGHRASYSLLGLSVDGKVYKSIPAYKKAQHRGWLELNGNVLPADFDDQRDAEKNAERAEKEQAKAQAAGTEI